MTEKAYVSAIYCYPVKSLRGRSLSECGVEHIGLVGDRRWMVVDEKDRFLTIRQLPRMAQIWAEIIPTGLRLSHSVFEQVDVATPESAAQRRKVVVWRDTVDVACSSVISDDFLSQILGKTVSLVYLDNPKARSIDSRFASEQEHVSFADGFPVLLTTEASLVDLQSRVGAEIDMRRFRPNIVVAGSEPWGEDTWRTVRIGSTIFRIAKPCSRCVVITRDANTGDQLDATEPLRTLGAFRRAKDGGVIFGQNMIPKTRGILHVGDPVEILEAGSSNLLSSYK